MAHGTSAGLIRILGQVSAIVVIPILGGAVTGIVVDRFLETSPLFVLSGFAVGNLLAVLGVWFYVRTQRRRMMGDRKDRHHDP